MKTLPEYLVCRTNAAAEKTQTVVCGNCRFTVITDRLLRIEAGEFCDDATLTVVNRAFAETAYTTEEANGLFTLKTEQLVLIYHTGQPLSADSLQIRLLTRPFTEWHYGEQPLLNLGGTVSTLDRVDGACDIDDGICALDGFALIDDSKSARLLQNGWFAKRPEGVTDLYFFGYGHDYTACVQDYYRLTGIPELLPAFALGNWWSRYHKYTDQEYLALMDRFCEADIPFSVGIVDMDWHLTDGDGRHYFKDGWTGYTWNKALFPDYRAFLNALHDRNLKTALNLHPALGVRAWEEMYPAMAHAMGIDPQSGKAVPFDCLNPDFWKAYFEILHFPYEADGVDFWWMDWQQGTDYWWIHDQYDPAKKELECITPLWLLNHMHFLASKRGGKRGLIFSRYSGFGSQRYPIGFSGDTIITWETLQFQPYFTATASNIGYGWWSHDIGGHARGYRDDELAVRWIQFGVFSPIFRLHSSADPFLGREPWNYNPRAEQVICDFMRLRHRLFPYLYTMNYRNYKALLPLMRPMYHTHPEEKAAYTVPNQYWFGSELIAAPITRKSDAVSGLGYAQVWLPQGTWIDWFTGYVYKGGTFEAYRPLEQMPLFCKAGAIVPMQPHRPHSNRLGGSTALEIMIAAGGNNAFTLFEDDGETENYKTGDFCTTEFSLAWQETRTQFTIHPTAGDRTLIPQTRDYTLRFTGFRKGCAFTADGTELPAEYCSASNSYILHISAVAASQGIAVTIENESGLVHDNSDFESRASALILHAQCPETARHTYIKLIETAKKNPAKFLFACENENRLPAAIYELAKQL